MSLEKYKNKKPFFALAPMANITTYPFASQCVNYGADLVWTPMVHTDTIINNWPEAEKILSFSPIRNYIVQIIGQDPRKVANSIKIVEKHLNPIGFDLNFACPDKNIIKSGCGGAMLRREDEIIEIVKAAKKVTSLPISIKTRAGWDNYEDIFSLAAKLNLAGIDLLTIHPRTVKQGFRGEADWEVIKRLVKGFPDLAICGSGDIKTWKDAVEKQRMSNCAGVMIGRGALGKPWIFKEIKNKKNYNFSIAEIKKLVLDLAQKADKIWGEKGITESKKHFGWYFKGFDGASEYRKRLMEAKNVDEITNILSQN